jgi:MFS family permease
VHLTWTRDLALYLASRVLALVGLTMLRATVGWHLYRLTGSAFDLGLVGAVQLVPALALSLPAGVAADRYERRRIVQIAQTFSLVAAVGLCVTTALGTAAVWTLFVAVAITAGAAAFSNPARAALLPLLVSREQFPRAVTFASTAQALSFAAGPALAGVTVAFAPIEASYGLAAVWISLSVVTLTFLTPTAAPRPTAFSLSYLVEGLRYVATHKVVLGAMSLDLFAVIFGGASALLPVFAERLQVGPRGYGALAASLEIGAVTTSIALIFLPPIRRAGTVLLASVACYGLFTIVFGVSRFFPLSLLAYAAVGMSDQVSVVLRQTMIQLETPDPLRGRVSAVSSIFIGSSNQLAAVESGFVAAATSAPFAVISGGIGVLIVVSAVALLLPELRRFRLDPAAAPGHP